MTERLCGCLSMNHTVEDKPQRPSRIAQLQWPAGKEVVLVAEGLRNPNVLYNKLLKQTGSFFSKNTGI